MMADDASSKASGAPGSPDLGRSPFRFRATRFTLAVSCALPVRPFFDRGGPFMKPLSLRARLTILTGVCTPLLATACLSPDNGGPSADAGTFSPDVGATGKG